MKYGQYLESKILPEWREHYIDYKGLKDLIKAASEAAAAGGVSEAHFSPRTTSLTIERYKNNKTNPDEAFFKLLDQDVSLS